MNDTLNPCLQFCLREAALTQERLWITVGPASTSPPATLRGGRKWLSIVHTPLSHPLTSSMSSSNSAASSLWLSMRRKNSLGRATICPLQSWNLVGRRAAGRGGHRSSVLRWSNDSARRSGVARGPGEVPGWVPVLGLLSSPSSSSVLPFPSPESRDSRSPHWLRRLRLGARPRLFQLERLLLPALLGPHGVQGELRRLA